MKFYILDGRKPKLVSDKRQWQAWMGSYEYECIVGETNLNGDVMILTVFSGCCTSEDTMLFETIIMGGIHDSYKKKSPSWRAAAVQHLAAIGLVLTELN